VSVSLGAIADLWGTRPPLPREQIIINNYKLNLKSFETGHKRKNGGQQAKGQAFKFKNKTNTK